MAFSNLNEQHAKAMKDLRDYMELKYGSAYMRAISKLSANDQYDERGRMLKPEYTLTSKERDALLFYVPETSKYLKAFDDVRFETTNKTKNEQNKDQTLDKRYRMFLESIREGTMKIASSAEVPEGNRVIPYEIVGIEFGIDRIIETYGRDVFERAFKEMYGENSLKKAEYNKVSQDLSKTDRMFVHLIQEGIATSPLIDLQVLLHLLEEKGIPTYIDFESRTFYYNGSPQKGKTK